MRYANGGTPQVGDRVRFLTWAGYVEGTVERVGRLMVMAGGVWNLAATIALVEPAPLVVSDAVADLIVDTSKFDEAIRRGRDTIQKTTLVPMSRNAEPSVQEVILNIDGRKEVVMNMGPGVNTVILSGKVDPDTDFEEGSLWLELFPNTRIEVPMGGLSDVSIGDEVLVTGHLEEAPAAMSVHWKAFVVADKVVKL